MEAAEASTSASAFDENQLRDLKIDDKLAKEERDQNRQEQEDELLVLESILGDDFQVTEDAERSLRSIKISINVELAEPLGIAANLTETDEAEEDVTLSDGPEHEDAGSGPRAVNGEGESSSSRRSFGSGSSGHVQLPAIFVQFLPPIKLLCTLPDSYPSRSPPQFSLWTVWLSNSQISRLCQKLDEMWEQTAGQVVIFSWIDWVHQEALTFLEISNLLILGPYSCAVGDPRAISEGQSIEHDISCLLRYNEERKFQEFRSSIHTCQICFTEMPGTEFIRLSCAHTSCVNCMRQHCALHVKEGTLSRLTCPEPTCKSSLPPDVLKQLLSPEDFQRWESMLLQRTLDTMGDLVYCPRCEVPCIEDSDHFCLCAKCQFSFCGLCQAAWHGSKQCMSPEARLHILQERSKGKEQGDAARMQEQALLNEVMFMKYVHKSAKQCPVCRMAIEKSGGCNKVECRNCFARFCYRCSKRIYDYDHFSANGCVLFDVEEVNAWNAMMGNNFGGGGHRANNNEFNQNEALQARERRCPICGQLNLKVGGNNHIRCWSCNQHFCGMCNNSVQKSSTHFGQKGKCKQHSPD